MNESVISTGSDLGKHKKNHLPLAKVPEILLLLSFFFALLLGLIDYIYSFREGLSFSQYLADHRYFSGYLMLILFSIITLGRIRVNKNLIVCMGLLFFGNAMTICLASIQVNSETYIADAMDSLYFLFYTPGLLFIMMYNNFSGTSPRILTQKSALVVNIVLLSCMSLMNIQPFFETSKNFLVGDVVFDMIQLTGLLSILLEISAFCFFIARYAILLKEYKKYSERNQLVERPFDGLVWWSGAVFFAMTVLLILYVVAPAIDRPWWTSGYEILINTQGQEAWVIVILLSAGIICSLMLLTFNVIFKKHGLLNRPMSRKGKLVAGIGLPVTFIVFVLLLFQWGNVFAPRHHERDRVLKMYIRHLYNREYDLAKELSSPETLPFLDSLKSADTNFSRTIRKVDWVNVDSYYQYEDNASCNVYIGFENDDREEKTAEMVRINGYWLVHSTIDPGDNARRE